MAVGSMYIYVVEDTGISTDSEQFAESSDQIALHTHPYPRDLPFTKVHDV